ncbi:DUF6368 family protein [Streptomyces albogriseolus]
MSGPTLGIADDDWMALGTAEFLRSWVGHPAFRLVRLRRERGVRPADALLT